MSRSATTRREFHAQALTLTVAPLATGAQAPPALSAVDALAHLVRQRHGRHLDAEQLRQVRTAIARNQRLAERLAQVSLRNDDEPATWFSPDV